MKQILRLLTRIFALFLLGFVWISCQNAQSGSEEGQPTTEPETHWLIGKWTTNAFDGRLDESWTQEGENIILKSGFYIDKSGDTTYSEVVKIHSLDGNWYLLAVPNKGNPLIYKAETFTPEKMEFGNSQYQKDFPYKVVYQFTDSAHFSRTTLGNFNGKKTITEFDFLRIE